MSNSLRLLEIRRLRFRWMVTAENQFGQFWSLVGPASQLMPRYQQLAADIPTTASWPCHKVVKQFHNIAAVVPEVPMCLFSLLKSDQILNRTGVSHIFGTRPSVVEVTDFLPQPY